MLRYAGEARGKLVEVDRMDAGALEANPGCPLVLLVKAASGDEEVGALSVDLKGVILCHGLPHLSHLGALIHSFGAFSPQETAWSLKGGVQA